jgi:hypothetical protein
MRQTALSILLALSFSLPVFADSNLLEDKGNWPLPGPQTVQLESVEGMSHLYKVTGKKGDCYNLAVQSDVFAPTIVVAQGKASVAFGACVSPETVDEYGRTFTSAWYEKPTWTTTMSVCQDEDGDVSLLVGRGWVWVSKPDEDGQGFTQHLERAGALGGNYTISGSRY